MDVVALRRQRVESLRSGKSLERRQFCVRDCEFRSDDTDDSQYRFTGYASLTETPYTVADFEETIKRGAFKRTLKENPDVVFRVEHTGLPLARTARPGSATGTLDLIEDPRGLKVDARFDREDPDAQKLKIKMDRELVDEMSFAFRCTDDDWNGDYTKRTVNSVSLHGGDVSAVTFGASPSTGATTSMRSAEWYEREVRGKYSATELAELGGKGEAFPNPDGHWSFPTHDRDDWEKARSMVGLSGAEHNSVRLYLMKRARAMGLSRLIPATWGADGSARARTVNWRQRAQEQEIEVMRLREGPMCARRAGARR